MTQSKDWQLISEIHYIFSNTFYGVRGVKCLKICDLYFVICYFSIIFHFDYLLMVTISINFVIHRRCAFRFNLTNTIIWYTNDLKIQLWNKKLVWNKTDGRCFWYWWSSSLSTFAFRSCMPILRPKQERQHRLPKLIAE